MITILIHKWAKSCEGPYAISMEKQGFEEVDITVR